MSAKFYHSLQGVPMGLTTRSVDEAKLDKNARQEVYSLMDLEREVRRALGI